MTSEPIHPHFESAIQLRGELDRPSRALWLVKWWLLAIPPYFILEGISGGHVVAWDWDEADLLRTAGLSLITVLVLTAAVGPSFTARYPGRLFDPVIGIHRWMPRVLAYAVLLRDDHPPFGLDQGLVDPAARAGDVR
jgi:hypothetical protein